MFEPRDPDFEARVRASFARQGAMRVMGAAMTRAAPGETEIALTHGPDVTQQHGLFHGGVTTSVLDSACGYAALSLMAPGFAVLTVELKMSFLAPADGARLIARGWVIKPGRTLSFCEGAAFVLNDGTERKIATISATMMAVANREGFID
jgi:uncharacterized protein (TIGR00369 family)